MILGCFSHSIISAIHITFNRSYCAYIFIFLCIWIIYKCFGLKICFIALMSAVMKPSIYDSNTTWYRCNKSYLLHGWLWNYQYILSHEIKFIQSLHTLWLLEKKIWRHIAASNWELMFFFSPWWHISNWINTSRLGACLIYQEKLCNSRS